MARTQNNDRIRASIAYEAARIICNQGRRDYRSARTKAAQRLGYTEHKALPSNAEIEQALMQYQQLFHADRQQHLLHDLRQLALEAMTALRQFSPRLVGPILSGSVDSHSPLQLHLFTESPEQIALFLLDRGIPYREIEKTVSFSKDRKLRQPAFIFHSGDTEMELIWFPPESMAHPPLSTIDHRPEKRASITKLKEMMHGKQNPE